MMQLSSRWSKTCTSIADSASASSDTFQCMQFLPLFSLFFLPILGDLSFLGIQRPEDRATLLLSAWSNLIIQKYSWALLQALLCMLLASAHKRHLAQQVVRFGSPGSIPMIQAPFNSSCVALQYKTGTKFCLDLQQLDRWLNGWFLDTPLLRDMN